MIDTNTARYLSSVGFKIPSTRPCRQIGKAAGLKIRCLRVRLPSGLLMTLNMKTVNEFVKQIYIETYGQDVWDAMEETIEREKEERSKCNCPCHNELIRERDDE